MAIGDSWSSAQGAGDYRLPGPDRLGWWAAAAMLVSVLLHVGVFLLLDHLEIGLRFDPPRDLVTERVQVRQVDVSPAEITAQELPEETVQPPADAATLLEEVDLLSVLPKDREIDIKPDLEQAEYALQVKAPVQEGDPAALAAELAAGFEVDADLPEFGRGPEEVKPAEVGQLTVDPGAVKADDESLGRFALDVLKRGAGGQAEKGSLDGLVPLDELLNLPPNVLLSKKTMLPSDLLFEFNKAELRESAKVGLMKLALLMDLNPALYCWVEGHTDMVGGDAFNLELSIRRAESVKRYLVGSLGMDEARISTRGFGRFAPIVTSGDEQAQAVNRRVEVRMRKTPPTEAQIRAGGEPSSGVKAPRATIVAPQAVPVREDPPPQVRENPDKAGKTFLVKPGKAVLVEDAPSPPKARPVPPRAKPVGAKPVPES